MCAGFSTCIQIFHLNDELYRSYHCYKHRKLLSILFGCEELRKTLLELDLLMSVDFEG